MASSSSEFNRNMCIALLGVFLVCFVQPGFSQIFGNDLGISGNFDAGGNVNANKTIGNEEFSIDKSFDIHKEFGGSTPPVITFPPTTSTSTTTPPPYTPCHENRYIPPRFTGAPNKHY